MPKGDAFERKVEKELDMPEKTWFLTTRKAAKILRDELRKLNARAK